MGIAGFLFSCFSCSCCVLEFAVLIIRVPTLVSPALEISDVSNKDVPYLFITWTNIERLALNTQDTD